MRWLSIDGGLTRKIKEDGPSPGNRPVEDLPKMGPQRNNKLEWRILYFRSFPAAESGAWIPARGPWLFDEYLPLDGKTPVTMESLHNSVLGWFTASVDARQCHSFNVQILSIQLFHEESYIQQNIISSNWTDLTLNTLGWVSRRKRFFFRTIPPEYETNSLLIRMRRGIRTLQTACIDLQFHESKSTMNSWNMGGN